MIRTTKRVLNLVEWVDENTDLTEEDSHNLQDDLLQIAADITEKDAEIKRLRIALQDVADWNGSCGCDSCVGCFAAGVLEGKDEL